MPAGFDSDAYIAHANRTLDLSLGVGLGDVKGKVFRIGHLGSLNELELSRAGRRGSDPQRASACGDPSEPGSPPPVVPHDSQKETPA
jgi:alanine-glyoxylate transaminase/serine-glyoxylate transaminase/serine-pyruvate transaminase